jgi:hypothetical protein
MKPQEFWNSTYRDTKLYVESRSLQLEDEEKNNIWLMENLGNKLIGAGMTAKNPKNLNLVKEIYKDLFKEELAKLNVYERKASEGEDLVNLMLELTEELRQETSKEDK